MPFTLPPRDRDPVIVGFQFLALPPGVRVSLYRLSRARPPSR